MTDPIVPTTNLAPVIVAEDGSASLSADLVLKLGDLPNGIFQQVYSAILSSANLATELDEDVSEIVLLHFRYIRNPSAQGLYYDPNTKTSVVTQSFLNSLGGNQNSLVDSSGHEGHRALDATYMQPVKRQTFASLVNAVGAGQGVTSVLANYAQVRLDDEANANLAGWNASVGIATASSSLVDVEGANGYADQIVQTPVNGTLTALSGITSIAP